MRRAFLGAVTGAGLVLAVIGLLFPRGEVMAQHMAAYTQSTGSGGELIAVPTAIGEKGQMLTIVDPRLQTIGVYTIESATGKITLRSVRNIHYDLQMTDFNGENPLPREIRLQLEQR